jgi:hypothetical protein
LHFGELQGNPALFQPVRFRFRGHDGRPQTPKAADRLGLHELWKAGPWNQLHRARARNHSVNQSLKAETMVEVRGRIAGIRVDLDSSAPCWNDVKRTARTQS